MDTHACKRGVDYRIYASDSQSSFVLALVHIKNIFLLRSAKSPFFFLRSGTIYYLKTFISIMFLKKRLVFCIPRVVLHCYLNIERKKKRRFTSMVLLEPFDQW